MAADERLLAGMGLQAELLDAGCCGMAGAFGFDRRHYDVSMQVGELALLPAVRAAPPDTLLIADGFSCREQIAQSTGRRAFHTAEMLRMGLGPPAEPEPPGRSWRGRLAGLGAALALAAGTAFVRAMRAQSPRRGSSLRRRL